MLVQKKRKSVITTNSRHRFKKYPNIIKGIEISKPEQVWVADITYIRTEYGFNYLHLITDAYSKQIVGFELSDNMKAESTAKALKMALKNRKKSQTNITGWCLQTSIMIQLFENSLLENLHWTGGDALGIKRFRTQFPR